MLWKDIWQTICKEAGIWHDEVGSLHVAYDELEYTVLEEFYDAVKEDRPCCLLRKEEMLKKSGAVIDKDLQGSSYSEDEMIVDPQEALTKLPSYLSEECNVQFIWSSGVTKVFHPSVWCEKKLYGADEIYICNGADFETLCPE